MVSWRHLTALLLLLPAIAAAAPIENRAAVEQHLQRLSRAAQVRGPVQPHESVPVVIALPWRNRPALERLLREVADPSSPGYRRYLTPREFERRFAPRAEQVVAVTAFLRRAGLDVVEVSSSRALVTAVGRAAHVERALSTRLVDVVDRGRRQVVTAAVPRLPGELGARVVAVGSAQAVQPPRDPAPRAAGVTAPFNPAEIARLYEFDALYARGVRGDDSRASTIAVATAFDFDPAELQTFWREFGIARRADSVELIPIEGTVAPADRGTPDRRETTLDTEWASAMAPGARVLVYAGTDALSTTFLRVYDRIVSDNRAAVLTTSWGRCETDYASGHLAALDALFMRAAAQGISVVAASGDAGAFGCADAETPSVALPASHPYVLAVGGTSPQWTDAGLVEVAWSGSGGGISARWPAAPWQMDPAAQRVLADVALNADPGAGYLTYVDGGWVGFGGTSVGAPIWAALLALVNQARAEMARPPLGAAAPHLCEVAHATDLAAPPFVDVIAGDNGAFAAAPGWDFPTGWGVPRAAVLAEALSTWTPPADGRDGVAALLPLLPTRAAAGGAARLRFERRCLATAVDLSVRRLPVGGYTLNLDAAPVASFATDARGCAMLSVAGVDVRGHRVTITDGAGAVLFSSDPDDTAPFGDPIESELMATSMADGASGTVVYRGDSGRDQLIVRARGLALGTYDIRLGTATIGTLAVTRTDREAVAQFDTLGGGAQPLPMSPVCMPIIVLKGNAAYLRSTADALSPGGCHAS